VLTYNNVCEYLFSTDTISFVTFYTMNLLSILFAHHSGPFLAIVTGFGGKYLADRNQGPIGDSAIALGKIAAAAGKKAKEEHLFSKLKDSVRSLFSKKDQGATSK